MKTGNIIVGSVLDCNKKHLEKALKDYDKQLYLKWNPNKNNGVGLWEVRRKPDTLTAVPRWEYKNSIIFELQPVENDLVNHVMDCEALNYNILTRLREMDTWSAYKWVDNMEYEESKSKDRAYAENRANLRYAIKQHKRAFKDLQEHIRSGKSPIEFLSGKW